MKQTKKDRISKDQSIQFSRKYSQMSEETEDNTDISSITRENSADRIVHQHFNQIHELRKLIISSHESNNKNEDCIHTLRQISFVLFFFSVAYLIFSNFQNSYDSEVRELKLKQIQMKQQIKYLTRVIENMQQKFEQFHDQFDKLSNEILDIHMIQLIKEDGSMNILKKYSYPLNFNVDLRLNNVEPFTENFQFFHPDFKSIVRKSNTNNEQFFYSEDPFPQKSISYIQIKIDTTPLSKIAVGIIPDEKRQQNCIYCDSSKIYYLYGQNGYIYSGQFYGLVNKSRKTKLESLKKGDIIGMFINLKEFTLSWYVNSKFIGKQTIMEELQTVNLYPFVQMTNQGDHVTILQ